MVRVILIAGPTASGKSAVALALAARLGGTVVNSDSMQVYDGLRLLTARPLPADEARAPHRLYGHVDPAKAYSVGRWLEEVAPLLRDESLGPLIVVGGTGLYFDALISGIAAVPTIPPAIRAEIRSMAAVRLPEALHAELARRDPAMAARLRPSDPQRVLRALEVLAATGRSLLDWQASAAAAPLLAAGDVRRVVLAVPRPELRCRIATRFAAMMAAGALDEVAALGARGLAPDLPAMKALGVVPLLRHVGGEIGRETAVAEAVRDTRRYAKRQETWFRNRMVDWPRAAPEDAAAQLLDAREP
jgi:tRNA dimethylallyltransferase